MVEELLLLLPLLCSLFIDTGILHLGNESSLLHPRSVNGATSALHVL